MTQTRKRKQARHSMQLSQGDARVLAFIRSFLLRNGIAPTRKEIARDLGLKSVMAAQRAVQKLRDCGRLAFDTQSKRAIQVIEAEKVRSDVVDLPLLGAVAAGLPIEAIESSERIQVPANMVHGSTPHFVLLVKGNSMIEDHICDGDYVIVRKQANANNGEKVVALIDGEATLKRIYQKQGRVELHPANADMKPIIVEAHQHLRLAGVFTGLIRIER
jgi:repressor LexA